MADDTDVKNAIQRYESLVYELGEAQAQYAAQRSEVAHTIRRDLWRKSVDLWKRRKLYIARYSTNEAERSVALQEISQFGDVEALGVVLAVATDSRSSATLAATARLAADRIRSRCEYGPARRMETRVAERLDELIRGPVLDNYDGYVCARLATEAGVALPMNGTERACAEPGQPCNLEVWLQPQKPQDAVSDRVLIEDGRDSPDATFEIAPDSEFIKFRPSRQDVTARDGEESSRLAFSFVTPATGSHELWIELFQKNRIIQALRIVLDVGGEHD